MIQKLKLEKRLTINLKRGGGQFSTLKFDPIYMCIMMNFTSHDLKVKTGEMA